MTDHGMLCDNSMLGLGRLHLDRVRGRRAGPAHLHGRAQDARQAQERHQLPPRPLPEETRGPDEEAEARQEVIGDVVLEWYKSRNILRGRLSGTSRL